MTLTRRSRQLQAGITGRGLLAHWDDGAVTFANDMKFGGTAVEGASAIHRVAEIVGAAGNTILWGRT